MAVDRGCFHTRNSPDVQVSSYAPGEGASRRGRHDTESADESAGVLFIVL